MRRIDESNQGNDLMGARSEEYDIAVYFSFVFFHPHTTGTKYNDACQNLVAIIYRLTQSTMNSLS